MSSKIAILGYISEEGVFQPTRLDKGTHSLMTVDYEHHEIHAGSHYFYSDSVELGSAATQVYMFTTPNTTKWSYK